MLINFWTIPVVREKIRVKLALATGTGAPATLVSKMMNTSPLVALKQLKLCLYSQKQQHIYLIFYYMIFFD